MGDNGENNIIIGDGYYGRIRHYDGNDWRSLEVGIKEGIWWTDMWMSDKSVIIIGQLLDESPQKTIVLYGK